MSPRKAERAKRVRKIGDRDGWSCSLCLDPVDQSCAYPDPRAPSIDHIEPRSDGGPDTLDNVRLTHWGCNHVRNRQPHLSTVEQARAYQQALIERFRKIGLPVAALEAADPETLLLELRAWHHPERYRERLAVRIEAFEAEGR